MSGLLERFVDGAWNLAWRRPHRCFPHFEETGPVGPAQLNPAGGERSRGHWRSRRLASSWAAAKQHLKSRKVIVPPKYEGKRRDGD